MNTKEKEFEDVFNTFFSRECQINESAKYNKQKYWNFFHKLWKSLDYIKLLEEKMDIYEKKVKSERVYVLEHTGDGFFERTKNPYHKPKINATINFCYSCGFKLQRDFTYCPKCGISLS